MAHIPHRIPFEHRERLRDAWRKDHLDPAAIWVGAGLAPGMAVADIGAGIGYFAIPAAAAVGPAGRVHAFDVSAEMLETLEAAVPPDLATRITTAVSTEYAVPLAAASVDLAMLGFVIHEVDEPVRLLREAHRILRPGGSLLVLDWDPLVPPPPGPPAEARISVPEARSALEEAGFALRSESAVAPGVYGLLVISP